MSNVLHVMDEVAEEFETFGDQFAWGLSQVFHYAGEENGATLYTFMNTEIAENVLRMPAQTLRNTLLSPKIFPEETMEAVIKLYDKVLSFLPGDEIVFCLNPALLEREGDVGEEVESQMNRVRLLNQEIRQRHPAE